MSGLVDDHRNCPYEDVFGNSAQIELLLERGSICLNASTLPAMSAEAGAVKGQLEEVRADPMGHATDLAVSVLNRAQQLVDSLIDEAMQSGS